MVKQNFDRLAEEVERKYRQKEKRRRQKMKVSGAGVKGLAKLIKKKSYKL